MHRNGTRGGKQRWICRLNNIERWHLNAPSQKGMYRRRLDRGVCGRCGKNPPLGSVCWDCLNYLEDHRAISL